MEREKKQNMNYDTSNGNESHYPFSNNKIAGRFRTRTNTNTKNYVR